MPLPLHSATALSPVALPQIQLLRSPKERESARSVASMINHAVDFLNYMVSSKHYIGCTSTKDTQYHIVKYPQVAIISLFSILDLLVTKYVTNKQDADDTNTQKMGRRALEELD
jgi:hypothetical protein